MPSSPRHSRTLYENSEIEIVNTREGLKIRQKRHWQRRVRASSAIAVLGILVIGLGGWGLWRLRPNHPYLITTEEFRLAVNRAMSAAELTQSAQSQQEWATVAAWWQEAAELMAIVPASNHQYDLAQSRVQEYHQNRQYALAKAASEPVQTPPVAGLWQVGSSLEQVLAIQGKPDREVKLGSNCQEIWYYHNSRVELQMGVVTQYDNRDNKLKVIATPATPGSELPTTSWSLGATKAQVLQVQGSPDQALHYATINQATLYYQQSYIELSDDRVIGYNNVDGNLNITLPMARRHVATTPTDWDLNSSQDEILHVEGLPMRVEQDLTLCRETYYYGNSYIEFEHGRLSGYANLDKNLRVR